MSKLGWGLKRGPTVFLVPVLTYSAAFAAWYAAGLGHSETIVTFEERGVALALAVVAFWWASGLHSPGAGSRTVLFVEHAIFVLGVNFVVQSLLNYLLATPVLPIPALIAGTLAGSAILALEYGAEIERKRRGARALIIAPPGADANVFAFASAQAVWDDSPAATAQAIATAPVDRIVVREKDWRRVPAKALLDRRSAGVAVEDATAEYERCNRRVSVEMLSPADLVLDPAFRSGRHVMAVQAIYTDLVGLVFLVLFSPLLLLCALAVAIFGGPGRVIERVRCTGFQYVPFTLLRFRTTHGRTGKVTAIGRLFRRWHVASLPQLLNVVRGEMVFFGPRPIREEFATELMDLIPFYSHMFSLKPGVLGWAQVHMPADSVLDELERMEYAFYYIKHGSLALDVEILARTLRAGLKG